MNTRILNYMNGCLSLRPTQVPATTGARRDRQHTIFVKR
jgi:hypothetical protein